MLKPVILVGILLLASGCTTILPGAAPTPTVPVGPTVRGVFEGITPCSPSARILPQIPADSGCEQMIWRLILYQDAATKAPAQFFLDSAYGIPKQGSTGLDRGGTEVQLEGSWSVAKGTKEDPNAVVYHLISDDGQPAASFQALDESLLHLLGRDLSLMTGNASWSYSLNRTDNQAPLILDGVAGEPPGAPTRPPAPPTPEGSSILGVFEGRLPCHEVVLELSSTPPYTGCLKIKTRLTFYQDALTGEPTTYLFQGTHTIREGRWTIRHGTPTDADAVIYQLQLDDIEQPVSILRADEDNLFLLGGALDFLVGNALFSYTLSRIEPVPEIQ
jgi:hypothetical protein